uniref:Putative secreted protein n=1 Tax=Ixodes ricinus TaxID=34613 RepID=A0A6B0U9G9_IXORI
MTHMQPSLSVHLAVFFSLCTYCDTDTRSTSLARPQQCRSTTVICTDLRIRNKWPKREHWPILTHAHRRRITTSTEDVRECYSAAA